jgi:hypothetical protein
MFGVAAYIQEHYVLDSTVKVRTISGSNYVGCCMLSNMSVESLWRLWSRRLDDLVQQRPWTGLYEMITMGEIHAREVLDHCQIPLDRMQNHHIRVASLDSMETSWARSHTDSADYLSAILAGAFIPGLCGRMWRIYRGERCLDGGIRLPWTTSSPDKGDGSKTLSVTVFDHPGIHKLRILWMCIRGLWARQKHSGMQYNLGYTYARTYLTSRLDAILVRRPVRLLLPEMNAHIRWDSVHRTFIPIPE